MSSPSAPLPGWEVQPRPGSAATASAILAHLGRVFSTAPLYAADHARMTEVAGELRRALDESGRSGLHLRVGRGGVFLDEERVEDPPAAERVIEPLGALGIAELEIRSTVTDAALHRFVSAVRRAAARVRNERSLSHAELGELPDGVRVWHREFGRFREVAGDRATEVIQRVLDTHPDAVLEPGYGPELAERCVGVVERLARGSGPAGDRQRSLEDVLEVGLAALERAVELSLNETGGDGVSAVAEVIEGAVTLADDADSARRMVDVLRDGRSLDGSGGGQSPAVAYEQSLEGLCGQLAELSAPGVEPDLDARDGDEHLGILVQLLVTTPDDERAAEALVEHVARGEPLTRAASAAAVVELAERGSLSLDHLLPRLLEGLRSRGEPTVLAVLLDASAHSPAVAEPLWPHLVDDVLRLGPDVPSNALERVRAAVRALPEERLPKAARRLRMLGDARERRFHPDLLALPCPELAPVLGELMGSAAGESVRRLLAGHLEGAEGGLLRGIPFDRLLAVADDRDGLTLGVVRSCLAAASGDLDPRSSADLGRALLRLLEQRAGSDELAERAIELLGTLRHAPAVDFLTRVCKERRLLVFRAWPKALRARATAALRRIGGESS